MTPSSGRTLRFTGVVPAAGASRRMGRPKALLDLAGRTFLERVVAALRDGGCERVLVIVAERDAEAGSAIGEEARRTGADVRVNPDPGDGPITSMRIALEAVDGTADGIAYLPLDYPLVSSTVVSRLIDAASSSRAGLTLPRHGLKRGHPALFSRSLFAELADPALEGGARIVVHRHLENANILDWPDDTVITDIDTPEAYETLAASFATEVPS